MVVNKGFCTKLCSDLDFEGMVIDICFDDQRVAMVNYEKGIENIEIEILVGKVDDLSLVFPLKDLLNILEEAKTIAIRCIIEDEGRKDV